MVKDCGAGNPGRLKNRLMTLLDPKTVHLLLRALHPGNFETRMSTPFDHLFETERSLKDAALGYAVAVGAVRGYVVEVPPQDAAEEALLAAAEAYSRAKRAWIRAGKPLPEE